VSQGHPLQFRQPTPVSCPASAILRNPRTRLDRPAPEVRLPPFWEKSRIRTTNRKKFKRVGEKQGPGSAPRRLPSGPTGVSPWPGWSRPLPPCLKKNFSTLRVCYVTLVTSTV